MARLVVRLNVGPGISPAQFSAVATDFSGFIELASRWAEIDARVEARRYVAALDLREFDPQRFHLREEDLATIDSLREAIDLWDAFGQIPPDIWFESVWRHYYRPGEFPRARTAALSALVPFQGPPSLETFAPDLFHRLVSQEHRRRSPPAATLKAASYRNPLELTLQDGLAVGGILVGTGAIPRLLEVLKDYTRSGRRERSARADEAEATASLRASEAGEAELRLELLRALAEREGQSPSNDALLEAVGDGTENLKLLRRLGRLNPSAEPIPEDD